MRRKTILCYGDSNTYGYNGADGSRFEEDVRWTGLLQEMLGWDYKIIEEGLNSRTTVFEDPLAAGKNGLTYLEPCLCTHFPIDLFIIMLGTNDRKPMFSVGSMESAEGLARLLKTYRNVAMEKCGRVPQILVISPIAIETGAGNQYYYSFNEKSKEDAKHMAADYMAVAKQFEADFMDAAKIASPSAEDGIHLDEKGHKALALAIADYVQKHI